MVSAKTCPGCGASDLGRGRCRTAWQELVRDLTPLRRYRCRACGRQGWTVRPLPRSQHPGELMRSRPAGPWPGRPLEERDQATRWRAAVRLALSVLLALLLGAVAASRLVSCQSQGIAASAE
jgi:hypothetical protein